MSDDYCKLMIQFNIDGDLLIWDDFVYVMCEELILFVIERIGGMVFGMKVDVYQDIEFNFVLMLCVQGKDNQIVECLCVFVMV